MIGLLGAKIWKENRVDFANPINLVPLAAGIIIGVGNVNLQVTDQFSLGGISLGSIVAVLGWHVARALAPADMKQSLLAEDGFAHGTAPPWASPAPTTPPPATATAPLTRPRSTRRPHHPDDGEGDPQPVKPAPFGYADPTSLDEALTLLTEDGAKVMAGGQSLLPLLSMRLASPAVLVDINKVPGLDSVVVTPSGTAPGSGSEPSCGTPSCCTTPRPRGSNRCWPGPPRTWPTPDPQPRHHRRLDRARRPLRRDDLRAGADRWLRHRRDARGQLGRRLGRLLRRPLETSVHGPPSSPRPSSRPCRPVRAPPSRRSPAARATTPSAAPA